MDVGFVSVKYWRIVFKQREGIKAVAQNGQLCLCVNDVVSPGAVSEANVKRERLAECEATLHDISCFCCRTEWIFLSFFSLDVTPCVQTSLTCSCPDAWLQQVFCQTAHCMVIYALGLSASERKIIKRQQKALQMQNVLDDE